MTLQEANRLTKGDLVCDRRSGVTYPVWFTELIPKEKNYYGQDIVSVHCLLSKIVSSSANDITIETARTINIGHKHLALVKA